ncbi:hypothetical protein TrST_g7803 [Triparma strigata]|uniref:6-phosphogluconolactonase n=1 Tax=Triparma strigata TaxID=1606541 RepID=A0A9W7B2A7_9STRA|nr:hypothetical protein TrST_g7803 [Triparma strigata]
MPSSTNVLVHTDKLSLAATLCDSVVKSSKAAMEARRSFTLALSGGSIPKMLSLDNMIAAFARQNIEPSFENWHVFLADERIVPPTSPDSNMLALQTDGFLSPPASSNIKPPTSYPIVDSTSNTPSEVSTAYEEEVKSVLGSKSAGVFDCVVCGMGEDGHTCSLFPGHALVTIPSTNHVDFITDSPKQPPERITLTFNVLNSSRGVIFAAAGAGKSDVLKAVFKKVDGSEEGPATASAPQSLVCSKDDSQFPCAMVSPSGDGASLLWLVDVAAAASISR